MNSPKVEIGAKWTPAHFVKVDTQAGMFCEGNSPVIGDTELFVQRALLSRPAPRRVPWVPVWLALLGSALYLAWRFA